MKKIVYINSSVYIKNCYINLMGFQRRLCFHDATDYFDVDVVTCRMLYKSIINIWKNIYEVNYHGLQNHFIKNLKLLIRAYKLFIR